MDLDQEMKVEVDLIDKNFNRNVIFKQLSAVFSKGCISAILGPNGSGKSTLIKVLSGQLSPDKGHLQFNGIKYEEQKIYEHIGYVAPYIDIPEEYRFEELLDFHRLFKKSTWTNQAILSETGLQRFTKLPIKEYSSGMKQRVKLSLNLFFDHGIYLFDEPCSHLDQNGYEWFLHHLANLKNKGVVILGSNDKQEYRLAEQYVDIQDFK